MRGGRFGIAIRSYSSRVTATIHPSAIVDDPTTLGEDVRIWHWTHVMAGAVIGPRSMLAQGCYVAATVRIGAGCRIQNNVSLYDGVILEDDVFVGPSAVFTNVTHPRAGVDKKAGYAMTMVRRGATIGANATIVCGVTIGSYALVGAGAVVTHDVPAHAIVIGAPARAIGLACVCGETLPASRTCVWCDFTLRE